MASERRSQVRIGIVAKNGTEVVRMVSDAQKKARDKWDKENVVVRSIKFYPRDADVLEYYDGKANKFEFVKGLIREHMEKNSK